MRAWRRSVRACRSALGRRTSYEGDSLLYQQLQHQQPAQQDAHYEADEEDAGYGFFLGLGHRNPSFLEESMPHGGSAGERCSFSCPWTQLPTFYKLLD